MIAVLPPHCSAERLSAILALAEQSGWKTAVSHGTEQTILAVAGPKEPYELEELLTDTGGDVIEILSQREYRRMLYRRRLMHGIVRGLAVLVAFGLGIPVLGFLRPPPEPRDTPESVRAGTVSELPQNSARLIRLDGRPVLLIRPAGPRLFAVGAICTHMDSCKLEWSEERLQIVCPCHGCVFDVYGGVVQGPASIPLASYEVERLGDEVLVRW